MSITKQLGSPWQILVGAILFAFVGFELGFWEGKQFSKVDSKTKLGLGPANSVNHIQSERGTTQPQYLNIPNNASPELREFLHNRHLLGENVKQFHSQNPGESLDQKAIAEFQKRNAALLQGQKELAEAISKQQGSNQLPTPPPLKIPLGASPQIQAFLTTRDQLMRDQIAVVNQHRTEDPATRQAAMQQWRLQNASRILQLSQQAQALAQTSVTTTK